MSCCMVAFTTTTTYYLLGNYRRFCLGELLLFFFLFSHLQFFLLFMFAQIVLRPGRTRDKDSQSFRRTWVSKLTSVCCGLMDGVGESWMMDVTMRREREREREYNQAIKVICHCVLKSIQRYLCTGYKGENKQSNTQTKTSTGIINFFQNKSKNTRARARARTTRKNCKARPSGG